ncbi:MAG: DUF4238 domain-containing protein [Sedimentisphaerales bacterium]|nr:DUF4238 domain-containing protein [Sedimentisphaerales bacterium]
MPTGRRQHLVPQMMIRKFVGEDGKVVELHKPTMRIGTRRRSPRRILYVNDFYQDLLTDLDSTLLQSIEQAFARYYPSIVSQDPQEGLSGEAGAALIDWIAAMLCRTSAFMSLASVIAQKNTNLKDIVDHLANVFRTHWFLECRNILVRSEFKWGMKVFSKDCCIVLTDNPVCQTNGLGEGGMLILVPLSKHRILFGGLPQALDRSRNTTIDQINIFLAGWADKSVFAAERSVLEQVKRDMEGKGIIQSEEWCMEARKPFLGIQERIQATPAPSSEFVTKWWDARKSSYGEPLI